MFHLYHHKKKVSVTPFRPEAPLKQTVQTVGVFRNSATYWIFRLTAPREVFRSSHLLNIKHYVKTWELNLTEMFQ